VLEIKEDIEINRNISITQAEINSNYAYGLKKKLYQQAITLAKSQDQLIPVSKDERITVIQIGGEAQSLFSKILTNNYNTSYYRVSSAEDSDHSALITQLLNQCSEQYSKKNKIIVGFFDIEASARFKDFGISQTTLKLLKDLAKINHHIVLAVFGNPYCLKLFGQEQTILMAYEDDPLAQQATAEIIMGHISPKGKLPVTVNEQFYAGLGITF
ncbi:MAG TPA: glycoside hydrolase family 3 C-terminal domain-containing protein, partial [Candidatus Babeliaceae bacterium]|nr:glycoside hydrolase family 3 C-terminal domain-containing protein [Candidatus Babeliaceae bacterium]